MLGCIHTFNDSNRAPSYLLRAIGYGSLVYGETNERKALVVGNSAYPKAPLLNPRNDAQAMAALLRQAGFTVDQQMDTSQTQLSEAAARFGKAIKDTAVKFGLFYYAGHGLQQDWRNYLVPVTADIRTAEDVKKKTVDVSELLTYMERAKGRSFLVILDACRDDPFAGSYQTTAKGLSQFGAPVGSLLAFATAPGSVAEDGEGANGLYTSNLLREFAVRGARLEDAFKRVRLNARLASKGRQVQ
ncbi:MAG: caspase family protein [Polaromonas sp.]|nr:caspase family protein [Polaromonas sp.]